MDLICSLTTKLKKDGTPYEVIVIKLTDTYEKLVFLEPAEKELVKLFPDFADLVQPSGIDLELDKIYVQKLLDFCNIQFKQKYKMSIVFLIFFKKILFQK